MVIEITKDNYEAEVANSDKPVLLDLWASWCGPCQMIGPEVEKVAEEHPEIKVGKVNVDEQMELAVKFKVSSIPMLVFLKGGEVQEKRIGVISKEAIEEIISK